MATVQGTPNIQGTIVQCVGAVTDIEFPREGMPKIYDALKLVDTAEGGLAEKGLTFEVEQLPGCGRGRRIAGVASVGLVRGGGLDCDGAACWGPGGEGKL